MRYWIGALCFASAAVLLFSALRRRRRVLAIAPRALIERHRAAALADPRSLASMGEIGRSFVVFFVGYAGLKTGLLWLAFDAHRYLSLVDLAGFYAMLAAYVTSLNVQTRWRLPDALAAADEVARGSAAHDPSDGTVAAANEETDGMPRQAATNVLRRPRPRRSARAPRPAA